MADYIKPVVFKLGEQYYGVDINLVTGIEKELAIVPVPNAVSYIKGIINLRGEVIPVFNLKRKFNMPDDGRAVQNMVIVRIKDMNMALDVDAVDEISDIAPENIVDMPMIIKSNDVRYFDRVANVNGRLIVLLDVNYILSDQEQKAIQSLKDEMEK